MDKELYEKISRLSYEIQIINSLLSILVEYSLDKSVYSMEITNIYNLLSVILKKQTKLSNEFSSMI